MKMRFRLSSHIIHKIAHQSDTKQGEEISLIGLRGLDQTIIK